MCCVSSRRGQTSGALVTGVQTFALPISQANATPSAPPATPVVEQNDGGQIQDIVVTATRRGESLQKVAIAVSAFGARELAATGTTSTQDLAAVTPGLTIANQSAAITPFIRGVGAVDTTVGQEAAVATYELGRASCRDKEWQYGV